MTVHESGVNFRKLIQDISDMYPFDVPEVVLVELVANCLDAQASLIRIDYDSAGKVLVLDDNGTGMARSQFEEYHDFAAALKPRGTGIGFAGLGAKVSFNVADRVLTETRSDAFSGGSDWHLASNGKLVWEDLEPKHLADCGTRVEVHFRTQTTVPYASREDLVMLLRRHYLPLLDEEFLDLYKKTKCYPRGLRFIVNGQSIPPGNFAVDLSLEQVHRFTPKHRGKRFGRGIFGIAKDEYPVAPDLCGVLLCTYGKVIKPDWFNQFPGVHATSLFGVVEVKGLVEFLTTSKTDFRVAGKRKQFEALYDPIRQEFKAWLGDIGLQPTEIAGTDEARKLERELSKLLDDIPELAEFFGFRIKKRILTPTSTGELPAEALEGAEGTFPEGEGTKGVGPSPVDAGNGPGEALHESSEGAQRAQPISRKARRGPKIAFAEAPERVDLAWVEGSNVIINSAHPSYIRVRSDTKARRIHSLFAIATAVHRFLGSEGEASDPVFVDRMLASWGTK